MIYMFSGEKHDKKKVESEVSTAVPLISVVYMFPNGDRYGEY